MPKISTAAKITNAQYWDLARAASPTFAAHTAKATADMFTEKGFEAIQRTDIDALNEFIGISMRLAFQKLDVSRARNPFEESGLVEYYDTPNGGFVQRISVDSIKPVSPGYRGLQNGQTVDPFIVRKPVSKERFFQQNFDYQSFITIQDFQVKTIFLEEYGMGSWLAGVMRGLANGYTVQEYENTLAAINAAINSDTHPLQATQLLAVDSWTGDGTTEELKQFILFVKNVASEMGAVAQSSAYNANKFMTYVDADQYVMLVRPGIKNRIAVELEVGAFNPDRLSLPFTVKEVENFGGIQYWSDIDNVATRVYPVYDQFGAVVPEEFATQENQQVSDVETPVYTVDPNADVLAIIAQKGVIFENRQNPYTVTPIYNPRGMYMNHWANSPGNTIAYDANYNLITISKPVA